MKTPAALFLTTVLALITAPLTMTGATNTEPAASAPAAPALSTPEFDRFVLRLKSCKGMIPALSQWLNVLKPALQDLGYDAEQIKQIKGALCKNTVSLDDARRFSERWLVRYREQVNPQDIYEFLRHGKTPPAAVELATK